MKNTKMKNTRILITGSNGLIGRNLYKHLVKEGYHVRGIDLQNSDYNMDLSDLNEIDRTILEDAIIHTDVVFHLAAQVGVDLCHNKGTMIISQEIDNNLFPLFEKYKPKVIYPSSSEVYGSNKKHVKETDDFKILNKSTGYSAQKLASEFLIRHYNFPFTIVRFFNVIGPGQSAENGFVIPRFIDSAITDKPLDVFQKNSTRAFMDIRDCVQVLEKLIHKDVDTVNIGNPDNLVTMKKLAKIVKKITKSNSKINILSKRNEEIKYRVPDTTRMLKLMYPWKPKYSLKDTIKWIINE